jgi:multidrug efflux pump subunit AcrA (membrane-fusion protein)
MTVQFANAARITQAFPSRRPTTRRPRRRITLQRALSLVVLVAAVSGIIWFGFPTWANSRLDLVTAKVRYGTLYMNVEGHGTVESAVNCDIVCRAKSGQRGAVHATTLKWLIDDGSTVKRGDVVALLDSSGLEEALKVEQVTLLQAEAAWVQAEENLKIVKSQNQGDIEAAKTAVRLAELDLVRYLKGEYVQARRDIEGRMALADSDLELSRERVTWSERMVKKGYLTALQALGERSRLESSGLARDKVREELRVLEQFTKPKTQTEMESKFAEARRACERVKSQAHAKYIQARIDCRSKKSVYENEKARFDDISEQIHNCTITAPQDGIVVHYNSSDQSRMSTGPIVAQGEPVREGQKLMQIPDLGKMQIEIKVHESALAHVQGEEWAATGFCEAMQAALLTGPELLTRLTGDAVFDSLRDHFRLEDRRLTFGGDPAEIRVHAFPDLVLRGHVKHVSSVPSQWDWMLADIKTYPTQIALDQPVEGLKPGMTADITILAERPLENVLTAPVESLSGAVRTGEHCTCYVLAPDGPEARDVVVGMTNESLVEIKSGLADGEDIILNPDALKRAER